MAESGTIKWFNGEMGYGFIQRDEGEDVFVHYSFIEDEEMLEVGDEVEFEVTDGPKGPMAVGVVKMG